MPKAVGRRVPLSLGRRVVCDFLHLSQSVPTVTIQKEMDLAEVVAARSELTTRPSWCSIFTKAYGSVVAARPDLRRAYLTCPWERLFEYSQTNADIVIEAPVEGDNVLVTVPYKQPENAPLLEMDRRLIASKENPLERVRPYRGARRIARLPRFLRRFVWWSTLNVSGPFRARFFGTFGVTSVANSGVESLRPLSPWITLLHYGTVTPQGKVAVRLTYDHRVLDGSGPSRALTELEHYLQTQTLAELALLNQRSSKAA